jgi:PAS domain S-box-containing protein
MMIEMLKSRPHLFDSIQVAFLLTDAHSKILYANQPAEDLFGYSHGKMEGQRIRLLFLDEDLTYLLPNIIYLSLYQEGFKGELLLRQRGGKRIFVHLHSLSIKDKGETFITFSFREIQRQKNLERERLEEEHWARLGRMVEAIAHQVRNPIVSIGGYAHRILKQGPSLQKPGPHLAKILQETVRLEKMIQQVEEYIRIPEPIFRREGIVETAEGALQPFSKRIKIKRISVRLETAGIRGEGAFFIDKKLVIKALLKLLENSLEAVAGLSQKRQRAVIQMTLFEHNEILGISISDNGAGIGKKHLPLLFEPFFTTHSDRVGLGLTFVKRALEIHGGEIQVKSQLKKGTTVTLYFPRDRRRKVRREFLSPLAQTSLP